MHLLRRCVCPALAAGGCSKTDTAQARGREGTAKPVHIELVREETVKRAVELVGTLAAVDQVTISSETDGKVSRILADLGDRVTAGQTLIQVDHEKQQYSLEQQKAPLARALAQYGAADPQHLPDVEKTPDVQKANADLIQAKQSFDRTTELYKRSLVPKQLQDDAATAPVEAGELRPVAADREEPAREHPDRGDHEVADRQLRDTGIPRV